MVIKPDRFLCHFLLLFLFALFEVSDSAQRWIVSIPRRFQQESRSILLTELQRPLFPAIEQGEGKWVSFSPTRWIPGNISSLDQLAVSWAVFSNDVTMTSHPKTIERQPDWCSCETFPVGVFVRKTILHSYWSHEWKRSIQLFQLTLSKLISYPDLLLTKPH